MSISIIIPTYNEADSLSTFLPKLIQLKTNAIEIIIVNDGSTDESVKIIDRFPDIIQITHPYNIGYGAAIKSGARRATGDILFFLDADGQHSTTEIQAAIKKITEEDYDMVIGDRGKFQNHVFIRKPGKWVLKTISQFLAGRKIPDLNSGYRAIKRDVFFSFVHLYPNGFSITTTMTLALYGAGHSIAYFPITIKKRKKGKSEVKIIRDGLQTILLILRAIVLFNPLKVFTPIAALIFVFGFLFSVYGIFRFNSFPKTGILTLLIGVNIFFFGLIADQISLIRRAKKDS